MEEELTLEEILAHFGLKREEGVHYSSVETEHAIEVMRIDLGTTSGTWKFRITLDYDPEFPEALIRIQ